ncbi:DUF3307 domain-containing protein [Thermodesulfobacteriota bacterium]
MQFIWLLIAHLLGDVIFNSYGLAILKRTPGVLNQIIGVGTHSLIHAVFAGMLLRSVEYNWLLGAALVFIQHFLIDYIRAITEMKLFGPGKVYVKRSEFLEWIIGKSDNPNKMNLKNLRPWFMINILDQASHVICLLIISILIV